jgi:hypothetical protein
MYRHLAHLGLGVAGAALATEAAHAQSPAPGIATYALVVGSNAGGPGQTALRYSEDDARRVAATLIELGGYTADAIDVVVHPTPETLRDHLGPLPGRSQPRTGTLAAILRQSRGRPGGHSPSPAARVTGCARRSRPLPALPPVRRSRPA